MTKDEDGGYETDAAQDENGQIDGLERPGDVDEFRKAEQNQSEIHQIGGELLI